MNDQNIVGERRTYSDVANTHDHSFAQLILPLQGTLFINTTIHQLELNESRLFFLPPQCQHTFYARDTNEFLVLDIPSFMLSGEEGTQIQNGLSLQLDERWNAIRLLILSEINASIAHSNLTPLFHHAYILLQREYMPRSLQFIHANFHQSIELKQLANLEGYNLTYYCKWFKQRTGMTPKTYLQTLRLQKAKELLMDSDRSILQIAQQVGYEHHSSLTRLFQQHENITPIGYRQQIRMLEKEKQKFG
ncbi:MAG: helix-turn-helix transcriptional regulator [Cyanobacteria bacterium CRU_2_1]|nr:helix-turn-helix transcriptional regulator [Cyanobacteria bacterium CRU_2_1]